MIMGTKNTGVDVRMRAGKSTPLASRTRPDPETPSLSFPLVAIGASAGGLEAVRAVLAKLTSNSGMAFIVTQHGDAHGDARRQSALADLLSKSTPMPVLEISNRITVKPNHVYVVPHNKRASIGRGTLLLAPVSSRDRHHSIDNFMEGLAATLGDAAIGVVLSGVGTDGTRGLAAIKAAGGFTFAQDPKSAKLPAMPVSAIEAGSVDFVLPPARIASQLGRLGRNASEHPGTLLNGLDIPVVLLDAQLRIVQFTAAAATLFDLSAVQEGSSFIRSASNLGETPWQRLLTAVTRRGKTVDEPFQHRNGRWYSLRMKPFGEMKKAVSGVQIVLIDEDQIRRSLLTTSDSLAASESLVETLLDAALRSILAVDSNGRIMWANNTTARMFGYDVSKLKGQPLEMLVPEAYRERHKNDHEEFLASARPRTMGPAMESYGRRRDGTVFPVEIELAVTKRGATTLGVAFVSDTTERKSLDLAIRQRELELSALFDNTTDAHLRFDSTLRITHANAAFAKVAGIPVEKVVGKRLADFPASPYGIQSVSQAIEQVFQSSMPQQFQLAVSVPSAPDVTGYDLRFIPEFYPDGSISAVIAVGRDITQEKKVQQALRQREQELSALFDNSPDVILRVDLGLRNLYMNRAWERLTGHSRETALGKTSTELGLPSYAVKLHDRTLNQVLNTRKPITADRTFPTTDGQAEYEVRYIPEFGETGVSSILVIGRDITEQRRLQRLATANERDIRALTSSLMTAQEQERRRFARDIHDSLCQHLGLLISEIGSVAENLPTANPAKLPLRAAQERALRIAEEARQIARQLHPAILEDLGLVKALQQLCDDFSQSDGVLVAFRIRGVLQPPSLEAASCVYRIAQEALNNIARHAQATRVAVLLAGHRNLNLSIRDDGVGFDPAAVRGAGGLGLVSMEERARMAGGTLSVSAGPGRGTRVRLIIPSEGGIS
jgi:PAS domain S-box-containing protein